MNVVGLAWNCSIAAYVPRDLSPNHTPDDMFVGGEFRSGLNTLTEALGMLAER
jgi:hypothetical protein